MPQHKGHESFDFVQWNDHIKLHEIRDGLVSYTYLIILKVLRKQTCMHIKHKLATYVSSSYTKSLYKLRRIPWIEIHLRSNHIFDSIRFYLQPVHKVLRDEKVSSICSRREAINDRNIVSQAHAILVKLSDERIL
jgi:hypothetical protein